MNIGYKVGELIYDANINKIRTRKSSYMEIFSFLFIFIII